MCEKILLLLRKFGKERDAGLRKFEFWYLSIPWVGIVEFPEKEGKGGQENFIY